MFWRLFKEDVVPSGRIMFMVVAAILLWQTLLAVGIFNLSPGMVAALSWAPIAALPIWAVGSTIYLIKRENLKASSDEKPLPGWQLALAKISATMVQLLALSCIVALGAVILFYLFLGIPSLLDSLPVPATDWLFGFGLMGYAAIFLVSAVAAAVTQCAYLSSRMADFFRRLLFAWLSIMLLWGVVRMTSIGATWLSWLPGFTYLELNSIGSGFQFRPNSIESGPYIFLSILAIGFVVASGYLIELLRRTDAAEDAVQINGDPTPQTLATSSTPSPKRHDSDREEPKRNWEIPGTRERFLIAIAAFSFLFLYDVVANSHTFIPTLDQVFLRPTAAQAREEGFLRAAPFVTKTGRLAHNSQAFDIFTITASGDIDIFPSESDEISVEYTVRTYASTAPRAAEVHEGVNVTFHTLGNRLDLTLEEPAHDDLVDIRVRYEVSIPDDMMLRLEGEYGTVRLHALSGEFWLDMSASAFLGSDLQGNLVVRNTGGDVWVTNVKGDVEIELQHGRVETHGLEGRLALSTGYSTVQVDDVKGNIEGTIHRGLAIFRDIDGDLNLSTQMTRVEAAHITGAVVIEGTLSPIELAGLAGPVDIVSDRANLRLTLDDSFGRNLDITTEGGRIQGTAFEQMAKDRGMTSARSLEGPWKTGGPSLKARVKGAAVDLSL